MRTSRLRRWVLRGALFTAAIAPLAAAEPASAEWTWNNVPPAAVATDDVDSDSDSVTDIADQDARTEEWTWN